VRSRPRDFLATCGLEGRCEPALLPWSRNSLHGDVTFLHANDASFEFADGKSAVDSCSLCVSSNDVSVSTVEIASTGADNGAGSESSDSFDSNC
jgi:hypothetical protein